MPGDASSGAARGDELVLPQDLLDGLAPPQPQAVDLEEKPGSDAEASEPGIFAESVSISSTRSAGVSDSAFINRSSFVLLSIYFSVHVENCTSSGASRQGKR